MLSPQRTGLGHVIYFLLALQDGPFMFFLLLAGQKTVRFLYMYK